MMLKYMLFTCRELLSRKDNLRLPEPELMLDAQQVQEYADFGLRDTPFLATYLYAARAMAYTLHNCRHVIDLACGPAGLLCILAEMMPQTKFTGVDLSPEMLAQAKKRASELKLTNIGFVQADITQLKPFSNQSVDGVISTMALHHLPTLKDLDDCFASIARVLKPNGAVYLMDFNQLKDWRNIELLLEINREQPILFKEDYRNSLMAAFSKKQFQELMQKHLPQCQYYTMFAAQLLMIIKTPDRLTTSATIEEQMAEKIKALSKYNLKIYNDFKVFFGLGGYKPGAPGKKNVG